MLKVFREPNRKNKISVAVKKMWADARKNDKEKYYRMINSAKRKMFEINGIKMNSIEYQIAFVLNELKLNWKYEKIFEHGKAGYLPDFVVEDSKLIIEAYGDFWHANPSIFSEHDTTHKKRTVMQVWEYDEKKKIFFESLGYKFIYFWESDIKSNIKIIKEVIRNEAK
jgi:G:T-mismatch repair DNA endonuclease (very short patch repair protein)